MVGASAGLNAGKQRFHAAPRRISERDSRDHARQREQHAAAQHHPQNIARLRAERHAHADLLRALRHREREQTVNADARQDERDERESERTRTCTDRDAVSRSTISPSVCTSVIGSFASVRRMTARTAEASLAGGTVVRIASDLGA